MRPSCRWIVRAARGLGVAERARRISPAVLGVFDVSPMTRLAVGPPGRAFPPRRDRKRPKPSRDSSSPTTRASSAIIPAKAIRSIPWSKSEAATELSKRSSDRRQSTIWCAARASSTSTPMGRSANWRRVGPNSLQSWPRRGAQRTDAARPHYTSCSAADGPAPLSRAREAATLCYWPAADVCNSSCAAAGPISAGDSTLAGRPAASHSCARQV